MTLTQEVINLALGMNMWVFGGYVRDVVVRGQDTFKDLDLCCPRRTHPSDFLRVLGVHHKVRSIQKYDMCEYGCMSKDIRKLIRCVVDDTLRVEIVVYDGTFHDWQSDRTTDFTCNLFYQSRHVHLGIRYVPDHLRNDSNPIQTLIEQTREGVFYRLWDGTDTGCIRKVLARAERLVLRGMTFRGRLMSPRMTGALYDHDQLRYICNRIEDNIIQVQHDRSVQSFLLCLKRLDIHLPEDITRRIVGDHLIDL